MENSDYVEKNSFYPRNYFASMIVISIPCFRPGTTGAGIAGGRPLAGI